MLERRVQLGRGVPNDGDLTLAGAQYIEPPTAREVEILELAAVGDNSREIAGKLHLAHDTVKGYRKRIIAKFGARNGTHAVVIALREGFIALPEE